MRLRDAHRGAALGLGAAALFGLSAPLAKALLGAMSPQVLAGLLYLGGGVALTIYRRVRPSVTEAPLERGDWGRLLVIVLAGGVAGPLLMLHGLQRTTAVTGSLLLNLEAPFTVAMAVIVFREHVGRAALAGMALIIGGAALLKLEAGSHGAELAGGLLVVGACAAWALDNNVTQRLSLRDPVALVRVKALGAGGFNLVIGLVLAGGELPSAAVIAAALVVGSLSYGLSIVMDTYALRLVGAAREAAYFATAPFVGALAAAPLLGEALTFADLGVMALMAVGVAFLLREHHSHEHAHEELEHAHVHVHDEHHHHEHGPGDPPGEPHAHRHRHRPLVHDHPHVSDLHHRHRH
jgi:drug/metabolite transporter (DMT)-like permease